MFQLNQITCALGNSRKTESWPPLKQGIATQSIDILNQPYRFGDVTATQMVPLVIAEFLQLISHLNSSRACREAYQEIMDPKIDANH